MLDDPDRRIDMSLYLDEVRWRRDDQAGRSRSLDQKLATMFALNAVVLAVFAASISLSSDALPPTATHLLYAAFAVFAVNVVLSALAYGVSAWNRRPALPALKLHLAHYEHDAMVEWTADEIQAEIESNERMIRRKSALVTLSIALSVATILLVAATVVVSL